MPSVSRPVAAIGLTVVVLVTVAAAYLVIVSGTLPIPAGTVFVGSDVESWVVHFDVPAHGGRLIGAWTGYDGLGFPMLRVVNGTVARPSGVLYRCPSGRSWNETTGSLNAWLETGPHTLYWGPCFQASRIVITEAIRLA